MSTVHSGRNLNQSKINQPRIRVLMTRLPKIIDELLQRRIEATAGLELVGSAENDEVLFRSLPDNVDILVLGAIQAYPPQSFVREMLQIAPKLRILILQVPDDVMVEYWLGLRHLITQAQDSNDPIQRIQQLYTRDIME